MIATPLRITTLDTQGTVDFLSQISPPSQVQANQWLTANKAQFYPVVIPWYYPVRRVFWANGNGISGNVDFGIYTLTGSRIYSSGSTAQSGTFAPQFVNADFLLAPGRYMFALAVSNTTATFSVASSSTVYLKLLRCFEMASAFPLPATATFATIADSVIPLMGISRSRLI